MLPCMRALDASPFLLFLGSLAIPWGCDDGKGDGDDGDGAYCETCTLDEQMPRLAAEGANDCGSVGIGEDPSAVVSCIEQALADGTPFTARQQLQGIDSFVEVGYVVDQDGAVQRLSYDSNICGAIGGCEDGCGPRVSVAECVDPRIGAMPMDAIVDCDVGALSTICEPPQ